jgi:hypothetical protein
MLKYISNQKSQTILTIIVPAMRKLIFLFLFLSATGARASDSLRIEINSKKLKTGDTLEFKCTIPAFSELRLLNATLNVWIEDIEKNRRWKFRYPIINGEVSAALAISDKISDGRYAVNFLVQRGFFKVLGEVLQHEKKDTLINYMMIPKNKKASYFDNTHVQEDGSFRLKSTLFADSAFFIFSPAKKVKNNYLAIRIETPLDSAFTPVLAETHFVTIGDPKMLLSRKTDTSRYVFQSDDIIDTTDMLPGVVVTSKFKTKVEKYNDQYSMGLFQRDDALVFDGLESDQISRSISVLVFLQGQVPGLLIEKNEQGIDVAKWRNEIVEIYVDEFRLDAADHAFVAPTEIAMIKVYRPPAQLSSFSGGAGAIAIYTKKGIYAEKNKSRHNFIVKGYTNMESIWH